MDGKQASEDESMSLFRQVRREAARIRAETGLSNEELLKRIREARKKEVPVSELLRRAAKILSGESDGR